MKRAVESDRFEVGIESSLQVAFLTLYGIKPAEIIAVPGRAVIFYFKKTHQIECLLQDALRFENKFKWIRDFVQRVGSESKDLKDYGFSENEYF